MEKTREEIDKLLTEGPPLSFYRGFGYRDRGVITVHYSETLVALENGEVQKHLINYEHFTSNPPVEDAPPEIKAKAQKAIDEAERHVLAATGFTPEAILDKRGALAEIFRGQTQAPFDVELY